jgi:hypothetical protein
MRLVGWLIMIAGVVLALGAAGTLLFGNLDSTALTSWTDPAATHQQLVAALQLMEPAEFAAWIAYGSLIVLGLAGVVLFVLGKALLALLD